jgi:hypothetical protein
MTDNGEKLAQLAVVLGALLACSGMIVLCVETWAWIAHNQWNSIPVSAALVHVIDLAPRAPSGSLFTRFSYSLLDLPLDRSLMALGLAASAIGLYFPR